MALSVSEQIETIDDSDIFLVDNFFESSKFVKKYNNLNKKWPEITFHKSFDQAFQSFIDGSYSSLLIDSDIGAKIYSIILRKKIANNKLKVYVYEEGQGTYRNDIRVGIKKFIFLMLGIGHVFGGSILTSKIFLYNSKKYSKIFPKLAYKAVQINKPIMSFIDENLVFLNELFNMNNFCEKYTVSTEIACLVLMEKRTRAKSIEGINLLNGDKFIKRHPHVKTFSNETDFKSIENSIPAELVIMNLSRTYANLIVFHFGTSSRHYLSNLKSSNVYDFQLIEQIDRYSNDKD